ncbi:MAG: hypothetical protein DCC59_01420 [Chloroflexi bacterium]|nr:hypothetical protein [Chloroflexota bacterium]RIK55249.1 MAG: hypothetical protein DCC59_01420 [Chloroflexota bacterium]
MGLNRNFQRDGNGRGHGFFLSIVSPGSGLVGFHAFHFFGPDGDGRNAMSTKTARMKAQMPNVVVGWVFMFTPFASVGCAGV